jgi:hypothetical protein
VRSWHETRAQEAKRLKKEMAGELPSLEAVESNWPGSVERMRGFLPEFTDEQLLQVTYYIHGTCGDCYRGGPRCQCWNDE